MEDAFIIEEFGDRITSTVSYSSIHSHRPEQLSCFLLRMSAVDVNRGASIASVITVLIPSTGR